MDSKHKTKTLEYYDYFVSLSKEMKIYCEEMTVSLGIEYHAPFIYEADPKTRIRMVNIIEMKTYQTSKTISENNWIQRIERNNSSQTVGNKSNKADNQVVEFFNDLEPRKPLEKIKVGCNRTNFIKDSTKRAAESNEGNKPVILIPKSNQKTQVKKHLQRSTTYLGDSSNRQDLSQVNLLDSDRQRDHEIDDFEFCSNINLML